MSNLKCLLGMHKYEVLDTYDLTDIRGNIIGKVIVNRCSVCGKIKSFKITNIINNY